MSLEKENNYLLQSQIVTKGDLENFKAQLLEKLESLLNTQTPNKKQWLKSVEVREMLNISPGTLQNLRVNGTLPYTKVGGILYYSIEDIQKVLQANSCN